MKLHYLNGENAGRSLELPRAGISIGRETDNGLQLLVGGVSRYHANIDCENGEWFIRDLGSTNGTRINGMKIAERVKLTEGDIFIVGDQKFRFGDAPEQEKKGSSATQPELKQPEKPVQQIIPDEKPVDESRPVFVFRPLSPEEKEPIKATAPTVNEEPSTQTGPIKLPNDVFDTDSESDSSEMDEQKKESRKRIRSNVIFYVSIAALAVIILSLFMMFNSEQAKKTGAPERTVNRIRNPFMLYYEKYIVSKTSVFRFKFLLENNTAEITLDDPVNGRHYYEQIPNLQKKILEPLKQKVVETGFMTLNTDAFLNSADDNQSYSRLVVSCNDKFNDVTVTDIGRTSFEKMENAIRDFLEEQFDLAGVSEPVDAMLKDARNALIEADEQFKTFETTPSNLQKSIANYKIALKRLKQFKPHPTEWVKANNGLQKAEQKMTSVIEEGRKTVNLYYQKREFSKAVEECSRLLEVIPQESDTYDKIKSLKIKIEKLMKDKEK